MASASKLHAVNMLSLLGVLLLPFPSAPSSYPLQEDLISVSKDCIFLKLLPVEGLSKAAVLVTVGPDYFLPNSLLLQKHN